MPRILRPTRPLADVNLLPRPDGSHEVVVCFMPDVETLVGGGDARAVLALDASRSVRDQFGLGGVFGPRPNYVQAVARKLGEILCGVTRGGRVSLVYWAVGPGGGDIEPAGEFDADGCLHAAVVGPAREDAWGTGTRMLPAIRYAVETAGRAADLTFAVVVTDGLIEDEADCLTYCLKLGGDIAAGARRPVRLVLIGVGGRVDEGQLRRFNDMFEDTPLKGRVDLFASGVAADMRDEADIAGVLFGELMTEEVTVAAAGRVTSGGREVRAFPDGLPGKIRFVLPQGAAEFAVETPGGSVSQDVSGAV